MSHPDTARNVIAFARPGSKSKDSTTEADILREISGCLHGAGQLTRAIQHSHLDDGRKLALMLSVRTIVADLFALNLHLVSGDPDGEIVKIKLEKIIREIRVAGDNL